MKCIGTIRSTEHGLNRDSCLLSSVSCESLLLKHQLCLSVKDAHPARVHEALLLHAFTKGTDWQVGLTAEGSLTSRDSI